MKLDNLFLSGHVTFPSQHLRCFDLINIRCSTCLKVEEVLTDGRRILTFRNGTKKEISADKRMTTINFFNGDVKKIMPDQRVVCNFFVLNKIKLLSDFPAMSYHLSWSISFGRN